MSYKIVGILKKFFFLLIGTIYVCSFSYANAVDCQPPFNGSRTVEGDCTYPVGGIKVYGDIDVGARTIIVPNGVVLGINLTSNKVEFSTNGKILFQGTGKMDNSVSSRNYITISYTSTSGTVNCPNGYAVLNTSGTGFQGGSETNVGSSGTIRCGKL